MTGSKKIKWLIYTVLVGLIPMLSRLLIWAVTKSESVPAFVAADFIAFGLVLHISNINEIEHLNDRQEWKTVQNGVSIVFIAFYSVLFAASVFQSVMPSVIDESVILNCTAVLAAVSLLLSFSVYHHISRTA